MKIQSKIDQKRSEIIIPSYDEPEVYSDSRAPTPGAEGAITIMTRLDDSLTVSWTKATDNVSGEEVLLYQLYYSTSDNITTLDEIDLNGIKAGTYTADISSKSITGLEPTTTYYINLIVKDEEGNRAVYTSSALTTYQYFPSGYAIFGDTDYEGYYSYNGMVDSRPSYICNNFETPIRLWHSVTDDMFSFGVWNLGDLTSLNIEGYFLPPDNLSDYTLVPVD